MYSGAYWLRDPSQQHPASEGITERHLNQALLRCKLQVHRHACNLCSHCNANGIEANAPFTFSCIRLI
jgi:hypothetical protein